MASASPTVAESSPKEVAPEQPDGPKSEASPAAEDDVKVPTNAMESSGPEDGEPAPSAEPAAEVVTTEVPLAVTEPEKPPVVAEVLQPPIPPPLDQVPAIEAAPLAIEPKQEQMEEEEDEVPAKAEEHKELSELKEATKEPELDPEPATTAPTTSSDKAEASEGEKPKEEASTSISTPSSSSSSTSRRVFQCSSCNTYYEDWNLFLHMRNVHNRFICLLCLGLFPNAKRLARHLLNRHGQRNNHFETTTDMMEWNKQRPCHMMCVSCESVECVEGQQPHQHNCGQSLSTTNADASVPTTCSKCGATGSHLCTKGNSSGEVASSGDQLARKASKKKRPHRSESSRMSSDLVVAPSSSSSGFKLKIKGLSSGNAQAVNDEAESSAVAGDDNNNTNGEDRPVADEGDSTAAINGGEGESGAFSFNFILSKKGLVRNPNPSRRQKQDSSNDEAPALHRHSEDEGKEEPETEIRETKEEKEKEEGAGVPPLLVSKLKLKIPKYIVPVESEDSEDYDEDDEEDDEDEDSEAEDQKLSSTENDAQFRPVKNEDPTDRQIKEEQPEGTAVDRNNSEREKESSRREAPIDQADVKREGDNSTDWQSTAPTDTKDTLDSSTFPSVAIDGFSAVLADDDKEAVHRASGYVGDEGDEKRGQCTAEGGGAALGEDAVKREEGEASKSPEPLVDADGLELADASSQSFELSLDQPLDHIPPKDFLRTCLRATIPFCLYCYHARRIAVNAKMLAVHMIGSHRFTALVDSITAEELMNATIVGRLKASLDDLEHVYFNLDDYDSEVVAPLKMKAKIFECFQCRFTTGTHKELYLHNRKLHLKTVLLCLMCRSTFYNYSELLCHICPGVASRDLNYDLLFRCYYCNVNDLPSAFRLMVHLRKSHAVCEVCLEECFDQTRLSNHAWKHKLHHFCYRCGIAYRNKQDITRHLFWKHGTESELCKKCLQKRWPHIYHFCLPPLQFNCDQCVLTFAKAVHLRVHKRLHTEESPHTCAEEGCEEKFISRRMLEKHGRVHSGLPLEGAAAEPVEVEGNANGLNVEKEEIIGGGASSKGGASDDEAAAEGKTADPIMAMPVPNLSESDSSDSEGDSRSARSKPPSRDATLLQSVKMASLSDSSEDEQNEQRDGGDTRRAEDNSMDTMHDERETTLDSHHADEAAATTGAKSEEGSLLEPPSPPMPPSLSVQQAAVEKGDSDDEDGERSKTKAIIDIWENFRSYQATQIQQQRQSDEEEEDLIAPLPPPILHVLQSDHDYALMYKLYSRIDDDQDLKEIQDIEMMRRSGKAFRRHGARGSECGSSACSCGANCSCSSDNVSSTTSGSSSSSSSSSSSEDESKMTKKQRMIKAQRKAKRRAKKLKKTLAANGVAADGAENDNLLLSINDEVVTRLPETDLETTESDTDEEFYDANPYKIAQERLAEKNKLDEEAEEEKRLRREKRRRHRLARRQAKLKDLEEKTGAALESRLEAAAAAACPESHALVHKLLAAAATSTPGTPTTPQNVVPPLRLSFSARLKDTPGGKMNGGVGKQRSRTSSPIVVDSVRFNQTPPPPSSQAHHHPIGAFARFDGQRGFGDRAVFRTASVDGGGTPGAPGTPSVNDEDSSSSSSNVKRSKRRRIPNRFYGYEGSDEESSMAAQAGLVAGGAAGAGGMFRPTPPPNLTWNKEDLPSSTGTNLMMNEHSRMSVDSKLESLELMYMGEARGGGGGASGGGAGMPPALKKRRRQSQHALESRANGGGMFLGGRRGVGARGPVDEDDDYEEDCDGGFSNDLMMRKKRKVSRRERLLLNDELISSGRTPKNSWTGGPQQQQQQHSFSGAFEKAKGVPAQRGHHPELAAQLQSAVRVVRPEPLPRLKIRTNGMKQSGAAAAASTSSSGLLGAGSAANKHYAGGQHAQQDASADLYCYCRRPYVGEMIGCDGEGCHIEWFHFECVGILMAPQGKWFCPDCEEHRPGGGGTTNGQSSAFSMTRAPMYHD